MYFLIEKKVIKNDETKQISGLRHMICKKEKSMSTNFFKKVSE